MCQLVCPKSGSQQLNSARHVTPILTNHYSITLIHHQIHSQTWWRFCATNPFSSSCPTLLQWCHCHNWATLPTSSCDPLHKKQNKWSSHWRSKSYLAIPLQIHMLLPSRCSQRIILNKHQVYVHAMRSCQDTLHQHHVRTNLQSLMSWHIQLRVKLNWDGQTKQCGCKCTYCLSGKYKQLNAIGRNKQPYSSSNMKTITTLHQSASRTGNAAAINSAGWTVKYLEYKQCKLNCPILQREGRYIRP